MIIKPASFAICPRCGGHGTLTLSSGAMFVCHSRYAVGVAVELALATGGMVKEELPALVAQMNKVSLPDMVDKLPPFPTECLKPRKEAKAPTKPPTTKAKKLRWAKATALFVLCECQQHGSILCKNGAELVCYTRSGAREVVEFGINERHFPAGEANTLLKHIDLSPLPMESDIHHSCEHVSLKSRLRTN